MLRDIIAWLEVRCIWRHVYLFSEPVECVDAFPTRFQTGDVLAILQNILLQFKVGKQDNLDCLI